MTRRAKPLRQKLLFFTGVPVDDGATLYRSGMLAKKLQEQGQEIVFASVAFNFRKVEKRKIMGLEIIFIGQAHYCSQLGFSARQRLGILRLLRENLKTCGRYIKLVRQERPKKIVVVTTMPISLMIGLVSSIMGYDTYLDIEDYALGQMEAAGYHQILVKGYRIFERVFLPIFKRACVCSRFLQKEYNKSMYIPNMIDLEYWRHKLKPKKDIKKIVFVGQVGLYHGQKEVLESFAPLLGRQKNLRLIFIGGGEGLDKLKTDLRQNNIKKQVVFTGQVGQDKVKEILSNSDVGILPLWDKPVYQARHPLKLIEYLAMGLIVVTNKVGEAKIIIKDGENGLLLPAGDIIGLARRIGEVIDNPRDINNLSRRAILTAKQFSIQNILPKWQEFLQLL